MEAWPRKKDQTNQAISPAASSVTVRPICWSPLLNLLGSPSSKLKRENRKELSLRRFQGSKPVSWRPPFSHAQKQAGTGPQASFSVLFSSQVIVPVKPANIGKCPKQTPLPVLGRAKARVYDAMPLRRSVPSLNNKNRLHLVQQDLCTFNRKRCSPQTCTLATHSGLRCRTKDEEDALKAKATDLRFIQILVAQENPPGVLGTLDHSPEG